MVGGRVVWRSRRGIVRRRGGVCSGRGCDGLSWLELERVESSGVGRLVHEGSKGDCHD